MRIDEVCKCGAQFAVMETDTKTAAEALQEWRRTHTSYHAETDAVGVLSAPDGEDDNWVPFEVQPPPTIGFRPSLKT